MRRSRIPLPCATAGPTTPAATWSTSRISPPVRSEASAPHGRFPGLRRQARAVGDVELCHRRISEARETSRVTNGRAAFAYPSFRFYMTARAMVTIASEMQAVAVGWQIYSITHKALDLGLVGLAQ